MCLARSVDNMSFDKEREVFQFPLSFFLPLLFGCIIGLNCFGLNDARSVSTGVGCGRCCDRSCDVAGCH